MQASTAASLWVAVRAGSDVPLQPQIIILRRCIGLCKLKKKYKKMRSYAGRKSMPNESVFGSEKIVRGL